MNLSKAVWSFALLMLTTPLAHADGTTTMLFSGVNGANDGIYYVSPYTGVMNVGSSNAQPVALFCDDINNEVYVGEIWQANVTNVATGNFSDTRYGNGSVNPNLGGTSPQTLYQEGAWIVSQFASHPGDYVSLQYALWDLMTPNAEPTSYANADGIKVSQWLSLAAADYAQINPANFSIVTNVGPLAYSGQVQEFIVSTPEPAAVVLMLAGMGFMFLLLRRRHQLSA
jgi:PEP-CTERM motif-containing protein